MGGGYQNHYPGDKEADSASLETPGVDDGDSWFDRLRKAFSLSSFVQMELGNLEPEDRENMAQQRMPARKKRGVEKTRKQLTRNKQQDNGTQQDNVRRDKLPKTNSTEQTLLVGDKEGNLGG